LEDGFGRVKTCALMYSLESEENMQKWFSLISILFVAVGFVGIAESSETPTFTEDVAPILYENCVTCHRAGEIAPMSLITYAETRPWSRSIKNQVVTGEMPPWHADKAVGKFSNDRRLTEVEKNILIQWSDGGAPEGDPTALPPAPSFTEGWQIGIPDIVLEIPEVFNVPAEGEIAYQNFSTPTNFEEDTWVKSIEVRAGTPSVVHHILAHMRNPDVSQPEQVYKTIILDERVQQQFIEARDRATGQEGPGQLIGTMAPGTNPLVFDPETAIKVPKGSELVFQIHYTSNGTAAQDRSKVGLVLADGPPQREMRAGAFVNFSFEIAPGDGDARVDSAMEFTQDATVHAIFPHTHLRGKKWEYRITYPDGRSERLLSVPNYDFDWQTYYVLEEPLVLPKGSRIDASAWYDNSTLNKANPDPSATVRWGDQTWEEMQYTGIYYSVPTDSQSTDTDNQ